MHRKSNESLYHEETKRGSPVIDPKIVCGTYNELFHIGRPAIGHGYPFKWDLDYVAGEEVVGRERIGELAGPAAGPANSTLVLRRSKSVLKPSDELGHGISEESSLESRPQDVGEGTENTPPNKPDQQEPSVSNNNQDVNFPKLETAVASPTPLPLASSPPPTPTNNPTTPISDAQAEQRIGRSRSPRPKHSTRSLIKSLHPSIQDRARSLEPEPLHQTWTFPQHKHYRIKDKEAFKRLTESKIEWLVTTGVLVENKDGLMWAATGKYLLLSHAHSDCTDSETPSSGRVVHVDVEHIRGRAKERYESDLFVPTERPATPIVEEEGSVPTTPRSERSLRFNRKRRCRDIETGLEELEIVTDNEGKTPRKWTFE